jgi:hypothetical protein
MFGYPAWSRQSPATESASWLPGGAGYTRHRSLTPFDRANSGLGTIG